MFMPRILLPPALPFHSHNRPKYSCEAINIAAIWSRLTPLCRAFRAVLRPPGSAAPEVLVVKPFDHQRLRFGADENVRDD